METTFTIIFTIICFIGMVKWWKNQGINPEYEAWLTQDKAKYPELYEEPKTNN